MEKRKNDEEPSSTSKGLEPNKRFKTMILVAEHLRRFGQGDSVRTETSFGRIPISLYTDQFMKTDVVVYPDIFIPRKTLCRLYQVNGRTAFNNILFSEIEAVVNFHVTYSKDPLLFLNCISDHLYKKIKVKTADPHGFPFGFLQMEHGMHSDVINEFHGQEMTEPQRWEESVVSSSTQQTSSLDPNELHDLIQSSLGILNSLFPGDSESADLDLSVLSEIDLYKICEPVQHLTNQQLFNQLVSTVSLKNEPITKAIERMSSTSIKDAELYVFMDGIPYKKSCWKSAYSKILEYSKKERTILGVCKAAYLLLRQHIKEESRLKGSMEWCPIVTLSVKRGTGCLYTIFEVCGNDGNIDEALFDPAYRYEKNIWLPSHIADIVDELIFNSPIGNGLLGTLGEFETSNDPKVYRQQLKTQGNLWENFVDQKLNCSTPIEYILISDLGGPLRKSDLIEVWTKMQNQMPVEGSKQLFKLVFPIDELMTSSTKGRKGNTVPDSLIQGELSPTKMSGVKRLLHFFYCNRRTEAYDWSTLNDIVAKASKDVQVNNFWEEPRMSLRSKQLKSLRLRIEIEYRCHLAGEEKKRRQSQGLPINAPEGLT